MQDYPNKLDVESRSDGSPLGVVVLVDENNVVRATMTPCEFDRDTDLAEELCQLFAGKDDAEKLSARMDELEYAINDLMGADQALARRDDWRAREEFTEALRELFRVASTSDGFTYVPQVVLQ